jgi:ATP-dependent helicase YprA (DUF1998 family)
LFIGLSLLSKPVLDPVKMVKRYRDDFDSCITNYMHQHPTDHDSLLQALSPIRMNGRGARLEMIESRDISTILSEIKSEEFDVELVSERVVPARQSARSDSDETSGGLRKLYSHQQEALDLLGSANYIKALVLHTSTSSGKSLVYQVCSWLSNTNLACDY